MARRLTRMAMWLAALCVAAPDAWSQPAWRPERAVEIITAAAAGGSVDQLARLMQKILQDEKLLAVPAVVSNKAGGNQTLALVYVTQHAGDPHYLLLGNPTVITNHIAGITPLSGADLTPIALLLLEHTVISVRADSPMKNMQDLVARLRADPESLAVGIVSRGGVSHLALSQALKAAGVDARKVKAAVFKTNAESMIALVGGHLQLVASSVSSANTQVKTGNARIIAIASPRRMGGALASVPTLKEQGIDSWVSNWRAIFGPKGMTAAQVAFWEEALAKMVTTDEWKKQLELQQWDGHFLRSREFAKYLETEYAATKAIMADLGLAKQ